MKFWQACIALFAQFLICAVLVAMVNELRKELVTTRADYAAEIKKVRSDQRRMVLLVNKLRKLEASESAANGLCARAESAPTSCR